MYTPQERSGVSSCSPDLEKSLMAASGFAFHQGFGHLSPSPEMIVFGRPAVQIMREQVIPHFRVQPGMTHLAPFLTLHRLRAHCYMCV